jgi:hypothetical protein
MMKAAIPAPGLSGVYHAPTHAGAIRDSVIGAGALWIEVDLRNVRTKRELLEVLARAVEAPAPFGDNWDALADVLQDLSWRRANAYLLHVRACAAAARALGRDWSTFLEILASTAMYWKQRGKPFVALVDDAAELPPWI